MLHQEQVDPGFVVHEIGEDDDENTLSDAELWDALTRTFQSPTYQAPMLPQAATELLSLSSRADVEVDAVVKLLERDTLLAGRVLTLCNSPVYASSAPVRSLKPAVVRLGLKQLRNVVLEASLSYRVFKTTGYSQAVDRVRVHSTATAHVARAITRFTSFDPEYAFLCGLLHDVGYSAALVALGDAPRGQKLRPVVDLWPALAALHETVGGSVATLWKLPAEIAMVVKVHHAMKVGGVVHPVAAIINLAEHLAGEHGFGLVPAAPSPLFGDHRVDAPSWTDVALAKSALGFDEAAMKRVTQAAATVLEQLKL